MPKRPPSDAEFRPHLTGSQRRLVEQLKSERQRQGLSVKEVATRAGLLPSDLSRLENSEDVNPTTKTLEKIAAALNVQFEVTYRPMKSIVITAYNASGGSGKTTFVREVGAILAHRGFKVLLIDIDPQATLSYSLGISTKELKPDQTLTMTISFLQAGHTPPPIVPHHAFGMDIIPSSPTISTLEVILQQSRWFTLLERYVDSIREQYDVILIDPTPFPGGLVSAAMRASDALVVPVSAEIKSTLGYDAANDFLKDSQQTKPSLRVALFVPNQVGRSNHATGIVKWIQEDLSAIAPVSPPLTSRDAIYKDAVLHGVPILHFGPPSKTRDALADLNAVADAFMREVGLEARAATPEVSA